jgi:dethiobiotin synthetase
VTDPAAPRGMLVITGTGTGVGKTVVTAAIAALALARGDRVAVVKPAQTGTSTGWAGSSDIVFGHSVYIGLTAVILNLVVTVVMTLILKAAKAPEGADETLPHQYTADPAPAPVPTPAGVGLRSGSE